MKRFWFDFNGSIIITGITEDIAKERFYNWINSQNIKYVELSDIEEVEKGREE